MTVVDRGSNPPADPRTSNRHPDMTRMSLEDVRRLAQELETNRAELELQNEELRVARDELVASRDRYREFHDRAPFGYLTVDGRGRITSANPHAAGLLGAASERLAGQVLARWIEPRDREILEQHLATALVGSHSCELRLARARRWVRLQTSAGGEGYGGRAPCHLFMDDVSVRRAAEDSLRAERDKLANTLESMEDGVYIANSRHEIEYANPALVRMFGPFEGLLCHEFLEGAPGPCPSCPVDALLARGTLRREWVSHRTGRTFDVIDSLLRNPDGTVSMLEILRDITELKRASAALVTAGERKDEFLAMLAHELRNPLTPMLHAAQVIQLASTPDVVDEARRVIEKQVRHMARLIDELLDASRVSRGKVSLQRAPLDLALVVESVLQNAASIIETSGVALELDPAREPVPVHGDPLRLSQILTNLLTNALKFTEKGGQVRVSVRRQGGEARLSVVDTGMGIAEEDLPHIFEMFMQGRTPSARHGGLGVGLALARELAIAHGGTLVGRSAGPGTGSEFVLSLPLAPDARLPPAPLKPGAGSERARHPLRVLVVDDNPDLASSVAMVLELVGHRVAVALDGPAALETARSFRPEAVILDIGMAGMDGCEVARRLRQEPGQQAMLLVALTGWGQAEDRRRTSEAGFDHHLTKPADPGTLMALLERHATGLAHGGGDRPARPTDLDKC